MLIIAREITEYHNCSIRISSLLQEAQYSRDNLYLSIDGRSNGCSYTETGRIRNVVIMMCTHHAEDRWTKHAEGIHVAMPNIRTSVLHELYQQAAQQHTSYHDTDCPATEHLSWRILKRQCPFGDSTIWQQRMIFPWWYWFCWVGNKNNIQPIKNKSPQTLHWWIWFNLKELWNRVS